MTGHEWLAETRDGDPGLEDCFNGQGAVGRAAPLKQQTPVLQEEKLSFEV